MRLPDDARAALGLRRGERVRAAAEQADGSWLAAPEQSLVGAGLRVDWVDVAHARWLDEEQVLVLDPVAGAFPAHRLPLRVPGRLPETVHERVMASIVVNRRVVVPGAGAVRVVGRAARPGALTWQVVPDAGVDLGAPGVRRVVDETVRQLRSELGE